MNPSDPAVHTSSIPPVRASCCPHGDVGSRGHSRLVVALTPQFLSSAASEELTKDLSGRCASSYAGSLAPNQASEPGVRYPGVNQENRERITAAIGDQESVSAPRATIIGRTLFMVPAEEPQGGFNMTPVPTGDRLTSVSLVPLSLFGDWDYTESVVPPDSFFLGGRGFWELPVETEGFDAVSIIAAWSSQRTADNADVPSLLRHRE